ncbi:AraC family transcriptional regulator [Bradyrhizobium sp.]|jgi:AraC family transcriptional regulator|uniref:helix-turn-helix domain-containing protein n=1 Tax=Bradyrhizobium sp. TaxID=376 RepID=UPI002C2002E8|nr:AraC family transcriptional regulator [Bradyrhizobium sp.]HWX59483.1 AraC family transcriptional regulator [Bradyrhizobium sp.]
MKQQEAGLLKSSAGRGWRGVRAELRSHAPGLIVERNLAVDTTISIAVGGSSEAVVRRKSGKNLDECAAVKGTVWVCPAGIVQDLTETSALAPQILHVYVPREGFDCLADDSLRGTDPHEYVRYANGYSDPLIAQCGFAIAEELHQQSSTGRILVESIANTLAVRVVHSNIGRPPDGAKAALRSGLDARRLLRVLDAVDAGLEEDLSLAYLASVACLSPFHFARAFKTAMGVSPHQYVSGRRLERAKDLILTGAIPLSQIAASLGFSSQANFNRAFKAATGVTPTGYRHTMLN